MVGAQTFVLEDVWTLLMIGPEVASVIQDYTKFSGKTLLKETLGHQNRQSSCVLGATTDFDPQVYGEVLFDEKGICPAYQETMFLRRPNAEVCFAMRPDSEDEISQDIADLDAIEEIVQPYGAELVALYFRIVHPSFPILHKKVFLEKHGRSYRESTAVGLGAVYILALHWWSYSPYLSQKPKPDAVKLETIVMRMLFGVHQRSKISDLQGGLVLSQRPNANSWALTAHLVAMAQNLGINKDCSDWRIPDWERGPIFHVPVAQATAFADGRQVCGDVLRGHYLCRTKYETPYLCRPYGPQLIEWGALVYGRPSNIRSEDWEVKTLSASDFPETFRDDDDEDGSADVEIGKQIFMHMVSLTLILAEILDAFFTSKAARSVLPLHETLQVAKPLQIKLKTWFTELPETLSVDETRPRRLTSVGYLHLAYYTAEVTLHRAILRTHFFSPSDSDLLLISRRAAATRLLNTVEFVKRLKQEHLQSFWYFSSRISLAIIGIFAGVLVATSHNAEERKGHMSSLADYRWVLRISNTGGADFMQYAVTALDHNIRILDQYPESTSLDALSDSEESHTIEVTESNLSITDEATSQIYDDWQNGPSIDFFQDFGYSL